MTDASDNIIDLRTAATSSVRSWAEIQKLAIFPAFRLLMDHMDVRGISSWICENNDSHKRPFLILCWNGKGSLEGVKVGLHFTYGGDRMRFDVSAVKDVDLYRHQTTFQTEFFGSDEVELPTKILLRASAGFGRATQIEASPLPPVKWLKTNLSSTVH